ncbi:alpha-L-glutamate ligase-like protein [Photobacterium damselae]|uniref:Glutathione synthase/Ribosomal protein S6 modification enzyme (Glutaminyl transferase) n=3 Tax=Photobacterium damselae TaxID=38293 RepID=D0YYU0_PHODD|nr:alpha-L-glutamate ligase-like protein [Photobacterium damselae]AWK82279.1 alpha-L-glutamate ligase-like protein [Photobacterium damselae]EEZ41421.1 glutathione synthase/Ribosomal protein S6 modification enzyme (glutaminyl transferase) [Photobacterium damselae subsp. damselae CIP 102761]KAB1178425.1 alpha-L-glutamate ligase-like protein [Photobacterium damselae subsp. damselae]KAB1182135.1 alpha-L-glutamate ligase-like protein [Photobacterium damselae subsp. damselae]MBA5682716.1 alpha-L-glu
MSFLSQFTSPSKLKKRGIMGMNQRNHSYIGRYNDRSRYPLVDNKLKTKIVAQEYGATVPELIGIIDSQATVKTIHNMVKDWPGFVIKPAQGSGGKGILVIVKHKDGVYVKPSGAEINKEDVERHITNTLAGLFSLGGKNDVAMVENLIEFDNVFDGFSYEGVPDVRVIVFKGYPVMAMMRCSTSASDGKANLHQGAVGVGIDIASGKAIRAVQFNKPIERHPDTDRLLSELEVPNWEKLLTLASSAWEMTGLGYMGTDMVLDKKLGPMVLELNARPGLAIQIANGCGLLPRLRHIEMMGTSFRMPTPEERVAYSAHQFGAKPQF